MNPEVHEFLAEIRAHPKFTAASVDGRWIVDAMEATLMAMYDDADDIELFDAVRCVVRRRNLGLEQRFLALYRLMVEWKP